MARLFGKAGKAGKASRPEQVRGRGGGAVSGGNVLPGPPIIYGAQPMAVSYARRLFVGTSLTSPMVRGRFRSGGDAVATSRGGDGGAPDLGALQSYRGMVGISKKVARLGAQAGPSSPAGYPSTTGNSLLSSLANMSRPDVQRFGGLQ